MKDLLDGMSWDEKIGFSEVVDILILKSAVLSERFAYGLILEEDNYDEQRI